MMMTIHGKHWRTAAYSVLGILALISLAKGFQNALHNSTDFQWSGARLFAQHIDPYRTELEGDPHHLIIKTQVPNYLQELYVLMWPIGKLSFANAKVVWAVLNVGFTFLSVVLLAGVYRLGTGRALLLGALLLSSTPFRIALGNGQQALLELALLSIVLWSPANSGVALGLSYFKYSFSPILFIYAVWRRAWVPVLVSLVVAASGVVLFWVFVGGSLFKVLFEPLAVSQTGVMVGDGDIASLLKLLGPKLQNAGFALALLLSFALVIVVSKVKKHTWQAAAALTSADLALFPHATYDYVLLAVPAAYLLSLQELGRREWMAAGCIALLWYAFKLIPLPGQTLAYVVVHFTLLAILFVSLIDRREPIVDSALSF